MNQSKQVKHTAIPLKLSVSHNKLVKSLNRLRDLLAKRHSENNEESFEDELDLIDETLESVLQQTGE